MRAMRSREGGPQTKHPIKTEQEARLQSLSHAVARFWKHYRTPTLRSNIHVLAGKLLLAQTPAAWGKSGQLIAPRAPQESETLGWFWGHVPSSDQRGRTGACHWPDELGLHRVIQRHEHLGIFSYFTDHVFEVDKQGQGRGGGKLGLSVNVYVLLLRLSVETKQENRKVTWATLVANACSVHPHRTENHVKPVAITQQSPSCSIFLDDVNTCMTPAEKHMPGAMIPVPWEVVLSIYFRYKTFRAPINQSEWRLHVQLLIQLLILPSGQTLWGHLCVIHHYGLRTWHTVDVQQLLNEWMTQSADCVLSIDYIQVTINGHGRWKISVRCMFPALIKLRHTPLLLLSKRKCRMEYCCPWVKTQSQCH